jgi:L-seryl-tRNA(Ser) seleniumtransferase
LSNRSPRLLIEWDSAKLGITGQELEKYVYDTDPRIVLGGASGGPRDSRNSSITIMPYMMMPGDSKVAGQRLFAVLSNPPKLDRPQPPSGPPANVAGQWDVRVQFIYGDSEHALVFEQNAGELVGTHRGDILMSDLRGTVEGNQVRFRSSHRYEGTRVGYDFEGKISGDTMEGVVDLGEYGQARWTARKHRYGQPGGLVRPVKNV